MCCCTHGDLLAIVLSDCLHAYITTHVLLGTRGLVSEETNVAFVLREKDNVPSIHMSKL